MYDDFVVDTTRNNDEKLQNRNPRKTCSAK